MENNVVEAAGNPVAANKDRREFVVHCPITGKEHKVNCEDGLRIPGVQAAWWHYCPACGGWHIINLQAGIRN